MGRSNVSYYHLDTQPNTGVKVAGILAPGVFMGTQVNMLPFFNGQLESTNRNGKAVSLNFLDGGGAAPLQQNLPANDTTSNQLYVARAWSRPPTYSLRSNKTLASF